MVNYMPFNATYIKSLLKSNSLWLSKKRGQNYLIDKNIAKKIVNLIPSDTIVFEVGTGLGALTLMIADARKIYSLEIDKGIYEIVAKHIDSPNIILIHEDFLKYNLDEIQETEMFFVSNLPYSISGEAIKRFIDCKKFNEGVVMVQSEFADRAIANHGSRDFGVFSILSQTYLDIEKSFIVNHSCFFPAPSVDSTVIVLKKKTCDIPQDDFKRFLSFGFASKRKTVLNNLKRCGFTKKILEENAIIPTSRPEQISVENWQLLYRVYKKQENI